MFHNLRFAIFPLLHSPFFRLVFLLQKENPLISFGILWIFFFFFEILFEKWNSLFLNIFEKIKFLSKFEIFLKLISSILFFGKSLNFYFIFFNHSFIYFFYHPFIISFHHFFFLKRFIYFGGELTESTQSNMSWLRNSCEVLIGGEGGIWPPFLCVFLFLLFFFTLSSSSIVTIHKLLLFFFISTPFLA